ncbi:MAG TPA: PLP-dependent aminotransferase family protein [Chitinophagales bacterium]|nr:PLP-dependent aminotransferase family protein [Chitinophagales bacterium]
MLPWKSILQLQKSSPLPVYLQISNGIIREIKTGVIKPGMKMPGTRDLSHMLKVHRQTVVKAFDELDAQGWITSIPSKGSFVSEHLPEINPRKLQSAKEIPKPLNSTGYSFRVNQYIKVPSLPLRNIIGFHDGPDVRLVPAKQIARAYWSVVNRKSGLHHLSYGYEIGNYELRKVLSEELNCSRGMQTTPDHIFISRGSQMGVFMLTQILISPGDNVIVGNPNYYYTDRTFMFAGAKLIRVAMDDSGIDVEQIEQVCRKKKIRVVFLTPHHHYPTTVTLSAARRMKLISLAEKYGFIIIEDDYDYDFHYESSPILPLASADRNGMVIYVGTLSKTIAPALRLGYVAAPKNLIQELCKLRQVIDIQGDPLLEEAVAQLFSLGEIRRHMKKALKEYKKRRDFVCGLLKEELPDAIQFKMPEGGLAIWAKFDEKIPLNDLSVNLRKKNIILSSGAIHNVDDMPKLNATRMGFGWMDTREAERAVDILCDVVRG